MEHITFTSGEVAADVTGPGLHVIEFAAPVSLLSLIASGGEARADPFQGTPDEGVGIRLPENVVVKVPIETDRVSVFVPSGVVVSAWGVR